MGPIYVSDPGGGQFAKSVRDSPASGLNIKKPTIMIRGGNAYRAISFGVVRRFQPRTAEYTAIARPPA